MKKLATEKFRLDWSVHMTSRAIERGLVSNRYPVTCHGIVLAVQDPFRVKVRRYGRKHGEWYHVDFWTMCRKRSACLLASARMRGADQVA